MLWRAFGGLVALRFFNDARLHDESMSPAVVPLTVLEVEREAFDRPSRR